MVKNSVGGNRTKRMARKNMNVQTNDSELRLVVEEGECYAIVKKIYGNGMCDVMCNDSKNRLCIIRNKFKGKGKSHNSIDVGKWLLVGVRDWEVRTDKTQKCDVLFVYSSEDVERLKRKNNIDFTALYQVMKDIDKNTIDDIYIMQNNDEIEYDEIQTNTKNDDNSNFNTFSQNNNFNIDDI
jgi:initiation factor 1A